MRLSVDLSFDWFKPVAYPIHSFYVSVRLALKTFLIISTIILMSETQQNPKEEILVLDKNGWLVSWKLMVLCD